MYLNIMENRTKYLSFFLLLFLIIGGCDVDFGGTNDDNGGGGGGGSTDEILRGTILEVIPTRENTLSGITVSVMEDGAIQTFTDTTTNSGTFFVEGSYAGNNTIIQFLDSDDGDSFLGQTSIDIFPEAEVNIGNVTLENGIVNFDQNDVTVDFEGNLMDNENCDEDSGSIIVESLGNDPVEIFVQVSTSTSITQDGDDVNCNDIIVGTRLSILGNLTGSGNNVDAESIELQ